MSWKKIFMFEFMITPQVIRMLYFATQLAIIAITVVKLFNDTDFFGIGHGIIPGLLFLGISSMLIRLLTGLIMILYRIYKNTDQLMEFFVAVKKHTEREAYTSSGNQTLSISLYILELESNIKWEAVYENWQIVRSEWVAKCQSMNSLAESAELLFRLESNTRWEAVSKNWENIRDRWVEKCQTVSSNADVAYLLLEFEANVQWIAVYPGWKDRRDTWIKELKRFITGNNQ